MERDDDDGEVNLDTTPIQYVEIEGERGNKRNGDQEQKDVDCR